MRLQNALLLSVALTITLVGALAHPERAFAAGVFLETFDGAPATPTPWRGGHWDVTVHSRDAYSATATLDTMAAMHGSDCGAPPATHVASTFQDAVFQCRDHVMTAIKAEGYGVIYLTPDQLVDFSSGEAVVRFDVSTMRTSNRDFLDFWITPFDRNVQLAGDIGLVDLNGLPRDAVQVRMDQFNDATIFRGNVVRNFDMQQIGSNDWLSLQSILTPSATVRTTYELRISRTHMKFGIPSLNAWWVDDDFADLGWSSGVLQIGHHSYNPEKGDGCGPPPGQPVCSADTWHWDNVSISPAVPFTLLHADRGAVDGTTRAQVTFDGAAPAGSHLRFTGIGNALAVSYDAGRSWETPLLQQFSQLEGAEHFRSYWTPIPAGTRSVQFRGANWWGGPWSVRNMSVWALAAPASTIAPSVAPRVTPTVATSTPNRAPVPSTKPVSATPGATVAPLRTASPSPVPTPTPLRTASPSPVPTPTPTPTPTARGASSGSVIWKGSNYYLSGANLPWLNWGCDFGCGAASGVSSATSTALLDAMFARASASGLHTIRWWVFEGTPWQVKTNSQGTPTGLDPAVYADFDRAMELAAKHDLYLDLVLFSSPTALPKAWETDPVKRGALAAALAPLFARYGSDPHLLSWEVFNEPEFDIWANKIDEASVQSTVRAIAAAVHANGGTYVTVGSAMLDGLSMWVGTGLDYYQAHWYDYMDQGDWCAICTDNASVRAKYGLDRPLVIGELYAGTDTPGRLETLYQKGYAGAWAWSLFPDRTNDRLAVDLAQAVALARAHQGLGPVAGTTR